MITLYPAYKELLKANEIFARQLLIRTYKEVKSITKAAEILKTTRKTVRKIPKRFEEKGEEGLKSLSRRPKNSPNRTPLHLECMIIAERKKTGYGRERILRNLRERGIEVTSSLVRYTLRRYNIPQKYKRSNYRKRNRFYDFEKLHSLEHFEVDLKEICDQKTLFREAITHAEKIHIPFYQRFLSFSYEKSFTNGLIFMMSLIYFSKSFGIKHEITLQTDNGEEFGGKSVDKLEYLNRVIFKPLGARVIHIPKGRKEYNAFVERSHQTDDNEFYIPQIELCKDLKEFLYRGLRWEWFYNIKRFHSGIGKTPYKKLCEYGKFPKKIVLFPIMVLDKMIHIFDIIFPETQRGGYHVLTNDPRHYKNFEYKI